MSILGGCKPPSALPPHLLPISNQEQARTFIETFFSAYLNNQSATALAMLCTQDRASQELAKKEMQKLQNNDPSERITEFFIRSIVPMWIGREPYYRTEVSFPLPKHTGHLLEVYSIRVRDGCVDGFVSRGNDNALPNTSLPKQIDEEKIVLPPFSEPAIPPKTVPPTPVIPDPKIEL